MNRLKHFFNYFNNTEFHLFYDQNKDCLYCSDNDIYLNIKQLYLDLKDISKHYQRTEITTNLSSFILEELDDYRKGIRDFDYGQCIYFTNFESRETMYVISTLNLTFNHDFSDLLLYENFKFYLN